MAPFGARLTAEHREQFRHVRNIAEWEVVDGGHDTPCWLWRKSLLAAGYPQKWDSAAQRVRKAYHLTWEDEHGPVADGLQLDHVCRNRACVNPDHLEPVTPRENVRRSRLARGAA